MDIKIYLKNNDQEEVCSFCDMASNPFSLGDEINLDINDFPYSDVSKFSEDMKIRWQNEYEEKRKKFRLKKVKLVEEKKFVDIDFLKADKLIIEYFCEFVND